MEYPNNYVDVAYEEEHGSHYVSDAYQVIVYCSKCGATSKEDHEDKVFNNECNNEE